MFYVRDVPWHKLGTRVEEAPDSKRALEVAGLNWSIMQKSIFVDNKKIKGYVANTRSDNGEVLGIVTNQYKVIQNTEAFAFTDDLIGTGEVKYETAGSLGKGERIWLLGKMPEIKLVDDITEPYLCFLNYHNGKGSVRVALTPVRVVCNNTLNVALRDAKRNWSTTHIGNIEDKLEDAKYTLGMAKNYLKNLQEEANILAKKEINKKVLAEFIEELLPIPDNAGNVKERNIIELRKELAFRITKAPDLQKYQQTAWGVINGVSDFVSHTNPMRNTPTYQENLFYKVVNGHPVIDTAYDLLKAA